MRAPLNGVPTKLSASSFAFDDEPVLDADENDLSYADRYAVPTGYLPTSADLSSTDFTE